MAFQATYADGRAAVTIAAECDIAADGLHFRAGEQAHLWPYGELLRTDDGNGRIVLRKAPDTGERLSLELEAQAELKRAAPALFKPRAQGVERPRLVLGLAAASALLATAFLVGVPLAAEPIARNLPMHYQDQIGEIAWSQVNGFAAQCDDSDEASVILNDLAYRLMQSADIALKDEVWVTIIDAPFPNAFALPDNSIVVTDELIALAGSPDELAGVIAHEIGHIEHRHVMTNVIRNIGAGIFFDVVFGGGGAGQAIAVASVNLAALRYGRADESEADESGLNYLEAANIDPAALARFFDRIAEVEEEEGATIPTLLASHPATAARAAAARARARANAAPALTQAQWRVVRSSCGMDPDAGAQGPEANTNGAPPAKTPMPPAPSEPPVALPPPELEGGAEPPGKK